MKRLLVLRHAKSSWKEQDLEDHERPLNKRGKHDAPRMGRLMRSEGVLPQLAICSTARRARATLKRVVEAAQVRPKISPKQAILDRYLVVLAIQSMILRQRPDGCPNVTDLICAISTDVRSKDLRPAYQNPS